MNRPDAIRAVGGDVQLIGPTTGPLHSHPGIAPQLEKVIARADLVHIHALWEQIQHQAAVTARRLHVPYVFTPHGMLDPWSLSPCRWKKRLYLMWRLRRDLSHAAALHFNSALERDLTAPLKLKSTAIVEPNGVSLDEFRDLTVNEFRPRYPQLAGDRAVVRFSLAGFIQERGSICSCRRWRACTEATPHIG